jgi:hypothetical protein
MKIHSLVISLLHEFRVTVERVDVANLIDAPLESERA